jgi:peptide deformylase
MVKKILQIGDPILEKKSKEIDKSLIGTKDFEKFLDDLVETAISEGDKSAGLSAPQIGENISVFVARRFDLSDEDQKPEDAIWDIVINPKIVSAGKETTTYWEGCLSIGFGENQLYGPVVRPRKVEIEFLNRAGEKKKSEFVEFMSHVFQHEIDHLNGILFLSHISNPDNIWTSKDLDAYMKEYDEYPQIVP